MKVYRYTETQALTSPMPISAAPPEEQNKQKQVSETQQEPDTYCTDIEMNNCHNNYRGVPSKQIKIG